MSVLKISTVLLAVSFILGCSAGHRDLSGAVASGAAGSDPTGLGPAQPDAAALPGKTVFDPLTQQLGKAREVQNTVDANTDGTRRAVDTQERGDSTP